MLQMRQKPNLKQLVEKSNFNKSAFILNLFQNLKEKTPHFEGFSVTNPLGKRYQ